MVTLGKCVCVGQTSNSGKSETKPTRKATSTKRNKQRTMIVFNDQLTYGRYSVCGVRERKWVSPRGVQTCHAGEQSMSCTEQHTHSLERQISDGSQSTVYGRLCSKRSVDTSIYLYSEAWRTHFHTRHHPALQTHSASISLTILTLPKTPRRLPNYTFTYTPISSRNVLHPHLHLSRLFLPPPDTP